MLQQLILVILMILEVRSRSFPLTCNKEWKYPLSLFHLEKCHFNIDAVSEVPEMVLRNGYKLEIHEVVTPDHYILTMFRIVPKGKPNGKTIMMRTGAYQAVGVFTDKGQQSHAFYFANAGYDVWLIGMRGTTYSYEHLYLHATDKRYWDFNLDHLSIDIRTQIKFISNKTNSTVVALAHSMGCTAILIYASDYPDESKEVMERMVLLAPGMYVQDLGVMVFAKYATQVLQLFYGGIFYGIEKPISRLLQSVCTLVPWVCIGAMNFVIGHSTQFPPEYLMLLFNTLPTGVSPNSLVHFDQIHLTQEFKKFDYGNKTKNIEEYGSEKPPLYNVSAIDIGIHIYSGANDILIPQKDIKKAVKALGANVKSQHVLPFNHANFLYAKNLTYLFEKILADLELN